MAIGNSIQRYPLLRLVISYICGIALADVTYPLCPTLSLYAIIGCVMSLLAMIGLHVARHHSQHLTYGLASTAMYLTLGMATYSLPLDKIQHSWSSEERIYEAKVIELPRQRSRSALCAIQVRAIRDTIGWSPISRKVYAYMSPTTATDSLLPGDVICFRGKVRTPNNFTDDLTFDYARYITLQGTSGTVYLSQDQWHRVPTPRLTLRERMLRLSHQLQTKYMHVAFRDDGLGVLAALSLGDKRALSDELRTIYSDAGASHVLALSGLHIGVIYAILAFVMRGAVPSRRLRWLRELLIIAVLWLFALLVGMPASVIRAVSMCTLYTLARWISHDSSPLHTLTLSALIMLMVRPLHLFDVGFQLSFMSMAAILILSPYVEQFTTCRSLPCIPAYFVGIIGMSIAAQVGTFPLSLHHFGTFPTYFLLTNLLVIPYLFVVLLLTLLWWMLTLTTTLPLATLLGQLLQHLTQGMNTCLSHIAHLPHAVLHAPHYSAPSALLTYFVLIFIIIFITKRHSRALIYALAALLALSVSLAM